MTALTPLPELQQFAFVEAVKPAFGKGFLANKNVLPQHMRCERDLIVPVFRRDKDVAAADFSRRRSLGKIAWSHLSLSPRSNPERFGLGQINLCLVNPNPLLTMGKTVSLLQTASILRRTGVAA